MSVGNTNSYIDHAGDGSSAQFAFGFPAISANDIKCRITHADGSTEELQSTAYSVVFSGTGGSVTVAVPPASGETLRIYRTTPITQDTGFDTGYINNADISNAMDKLTLIAQELKRAADGIMFSVGTVAQGTPAAASITDGKLNLTLPKGDKGDTGATGPSNTLSIGTVEGGATASATITGTSPNQTLNLVLPKGDKGDTGEGLQTLKAGTYPTYDSNFAPYPLGALLWYPAGGYFVRSLVANNTESDLTDTTKWDRISGDTPAGVIQLYGGVTTPEGWLVCDGAKISKADYPRLWNAIQNSFMEMRKWYYNDGSESQTLETSGKLTGLDDNKITYSNIYDVSNSVAPVGVVYAKLQLEDGNGNRYDRAEEGDKLVNLETLLAWKKDGVYYYSVVIGITLKKLALIPVSEISSTGSINYNSAIEMSRAWLKTYDHDDNILRSYRFYFSVTVAGNYFLTPPVFDDDNCVNFFFLPEGDIAFGRTLGVKGTGRTLGLTTRNDSDTGNTPFGIYTNQGEYVYVSSELYNTATGTARTSNGPIGGNKSVGVTENEEESGLCAVIPADLKTIIKY